MFKIVQGFALTTLLFINAISLQCIVLCYTCTAPLKTMHFICMYKIEFDISKTMLDYFGYINSKEQFRKCYSLKQTFCK